MGRDGYAGRRQGRVGAVDEQPERSGAGRQNASPTAQRNRAAGAGQDRVSDRSIGHYRPTGDRRAPSVAGDDTKREVSTFPVEVPVGRDGDSGRRDRRACAECRQARRPRARGRDRTAIEPHQAAVVRLHTAGVAPLGRNIDVLCGDRRCDGAAVGRRRAGRVEPDAVIAGRRHRSACRGRRHREDDRSPRVRLNRRGIGRRSRERDRALSLVDIGQDGAGARRLTGDDVGRHIRSAGEARLACRGLDIDSRGAGARRRRQSRLGIDEDVRAIPARAGDVAVGADTRPVGQAAVVRRGERHLV